MKLSLKVLENLCSSLNATLLKKTPYGIGILKVHTDLVLMKKTRRIEDRRLEKEVFRGNARECYAYLSAMRDTLLDWYPYDETREEFREIFEVSHAKFM